MTLVAVPAIKFGMEDSNWSSGATLLIDAAGEKAAFIFMVPKSGTIDRVSFRTSSVPNSQTIRAGLETLDASGDPSGTQYGGSAVGTQTAPAGNTTYEVTLGTPATATVEDRIALVLQFDGTIGSVNFLLAVRSIGSGGRGFPYADHFTTAWAKNTANVLLCNVRYSDGTYPNIGSLPGTYGLVSVNTGTNPDEIGNIFTPAFSCEISGIWAVLDADGDYEFVLYDTDGSTVLEAVTAVAVERAATGQAMFGCHFAPHTLTINQNYRLIIKPTTATSVQVNRCTVLAAAHLDSFPLGQQLYETNRVDAGTWNNVTTQRILCGPTITKLDNGVGGGGGLLTHPGMGGGFRG